MSGALLDSHALYWLVSGEQRLTNEALVAIGESQAFGRLYVSAISAWELSIAARKPPHREPPRLGEGGPRRWFSDALRATGAKVAPIRQRIALEAAAVVGETGHRDPGDCYLIATARQMRLPLVTRDGLLVDLAASGYLRVVIC